MEELELTPAEAMKALNWGKSKLYYWIKAGKFKTVLRETGNNVLLTSEQIERLKREPKDEKNETFQENLKQSEKVQNNSDINVTENYKKGQLSSKLDNFEVFNNALETIKQIHRSSIQNYAFSVKMLTDGRDTVQQENIELKAEKKAAEESLKKSEKEFQEKLEQCKLEYVERLKKSEKSNNLKNYAIMFLTFLILFILVANYLNFINFKKFETVQPIQEQVINDKKPAEVQEVVTPPAPQQVKKVVPRRK